MATRNVNLSKLDGLSIYQLREVGAVVGVCNPTSLKCDELRERIRDVVTGKIPPYVKSKSGRPHKKVIRDEEWDKLVGFSDDNELSSRGHLFFLGENISCVYPRDPDFVYEGYVFQIQSELIFAIGNPDAIHIYQYARIDRQVRNFELLRSGDKITATLSLYEKGRDPYVTTIISINEKTDFDTIRQAQITSCSKEDSTNRVVAQKPTFEFTLPQLQFLSDEYPVCVGQRTIFIGEDKLSGLDFIANSLALDLSPKSKVVYISCKKLPEDKIALNKNVEYFFSTFDINNRDTVFNFEVAFARAKALSQTNDTVLIVDDLQDIVSAYIEVFNNSALEQNSIPNNEILHQIKSMYASSGINANGGSLTIFLFSSIPQNTDLANFLKELDNVSNCHIAFDRPAFLKGEVEFLSKPDCWIAQKKRLIPQ